MGVQLLNQIDGIIAVAIEREGRREFVKIIERVGATSTPLIPLNDSEEIFPRSLKASGHRHLDRSRTAVHVEEYGIVPVRSTNVDDLPGSAECEDQRLVDAVWRHDLLNIRDDRSRLLQPIQLLSWRGRHGGRGLLLTCGSGLSDQS